MTEDKFPARLHVLIAQESNHALVIRRGPSKSTCVLAWDRQKNSFDVAQWLKGRIYERRSDISPNGKHWIYFAMNGKWQSEAKGAWTTVAKVPWLKAISLFAKGDCWSGGGLFLNDKQFWLNDGHGHEQLFASSTVSRNDSYQPKDSYGGECPHVYYNRLQRDGWVMKCARENQQWDSQTLFEKALPQRWILRKICHEQLGSPKGKGCYWDAHEVESATGEVHTMPEWEWAEWVDDAIIYAERGCLFRMSLESRAAIGNQKLLHDFNGYEFENKQAPY